MPVLGSRRERGPEGRVRRALPGQAPAGADRGGERAAAMFTLIETAKLNGLDPQA